MIWQSFIVTVCRLVSSRLRASNGKTTTKDMAYHVLGNFKSVSRSRESFNNFVVFLLTIFETETAHDFCIVEMGTNAPGEIKRLSEIIFPDLAILTNISNTHLEGLGSIEGVASAKSEFIEKYGGRWYVNYKC